MAGAVPGGEPVPAKGPVGKRCREMMDKRSGLCYNNTDYMLPPRTGGGSDTGDGYLCEKRSWGSPLMI